MQAFYSFNLIPVGFHHGMPQTYDYYLLGSSTAAKDVQLRKNSRSRGKHDPGSGKYWNRWVSATCAYACVDGSNYPVVIDDKWDGGYGGLPQMHYVIGSTTWDGIRAVGCNLSFHEAESGTPDYYRITTYLYRWRPASSGKPYRIDVTYYSGHLDFAPTDDGRERAFALYDEICSYRTDDWRWDHLGIYYYNYYVGPPKEGLLLQPDLRFSTRPEIFEDEVDLGIGAGRVFNSTVANAYVDAVNHIPDLSGMNNVANIVQLVVSGLKAISGALTGDISLTVGSLSDAWLGWRYSYSTTKADLEEAASYFSRAADLIDVGSVRCNGVATRQLGEGDILTARCVLRFGQTTLQGLKSTIEKYGLQLDAYAAWDLVPFSFIVDWFTGIGNQLEFARGQNFARRVDGRSCWCSIERRWTNEFGFPEVYYYRWMGQPDVSLAHYISNGVRGVTIVKRAIDVLALLA